MTQLPNLVKIPLKYGLVGALFTCVGIMTLYLTGTHPLLTPILFDFRILMFGIFIFFALREYRYRYNEGAMHFWEGMMGGLQVYLTIGLMAGLFILVLGIVYPEFTQIYIDTLITRLTENKEALIEKVGEESYSNGLNKLPFTTGTDLALDYFLKSLPLGIFLTIIFSVILRKTIKPI